MKKSLIFLLFPLFMNAQKLVLSNYTIISSGPPEGYERPRIVMTANASPFIIWKKPSTPKSVKAKKWNGTAFSAPYDIVSPDLAITGFIGPEIASKGDTVYLIFESLLHNNHIIYLKRSFDGGLTFSDTIRVSDNSDTHKFAMPNIGIRADGNPVISYMECTTSWADWEQMVKSSSDFGATFSAATNASALAPGEPCDCCQSTFVTKGNNDVYLLFRNNETNIRNSYIAKSTDGGVTFTATENLDAADWMLNSCPTSSPVGVVNGDSIMVVRRSGANGINELYCSNVNATDLQKNYFNTLDPIGFGLQDKPGIAGDDNGYAVVWKDNRNSNTSCFIKWVYGGVSEVIELADSTTFGHKLSPDICLDYATGDYHMVYVGSTQHEVVYVKGSIMPLSIQDVKSENKKLIKSVDLLAKTITSERNKPFINIYNDGSVERKIVVE
tara:strand:+ start:2905 stop:4227 length:1323 start_codon:yes stop_codon:yes gene_type:complete